jgi:type IV pilus assembly protein PilY1
MKTLRTLSRRAPGATLALGLLLSVAAHTQSAAPASDAPCCLAPAALAEALVSPPGGGDEDFFSAAGAPTTVMLLVGNNESMQDYVAPIPDGAAGCADADPFPARFSATGGQTPVDADPGLAGAFFQPDQFYLGNTHRLVSNPQGSPAGLASDFRSVQPFARGTSDADAASVCAHLSQEVRNRSANAYSLHVDDVAACRTCLAGKGWYRAARVWRRSNNRDDFRTVVVAGTPTAAQVRLTERNDTFGDGRAVHLYALKGSILNQLPPKFVTARRVVKNVLDRAPTVRVGVSTFSEGGTYYDPPLIFSALPGYSGPSVGPSCQLSFATGSVTPQQVQTAMGATREHLKRQINNQLSPSQGIRYGLTFVNQELSTGEALFGIAGFFSSQKIGEGLNGFWARADAAGRRGMGFNPRLMGNPAKWPGGTQAAGGGWSDGDAMWVGADSDGIWETGEAPFSRRTTTASGAPDDDNYCWACATAAVIVINDGTPDNDNSVPVTQMRRLGLLTGPVNHCPTPTACDTASGPVGPEVGNRNFMDDVAAFMSNKELDLRPDLGNEKQNLPVYTIGFGTNAPMLASIARAGGTGTVKSASNQQELEDRLMEVVGTVTENGTSFSAASLQAIQTGGMQSALFIPRFHPSGRSMWQGHLYRFATYNEFVEGCRYRGCPSHADSPSPSGQRCTAEDALEPLQAADLDQDGSCEDVHMVDSPCLTPSCQGEARGQLTKANIIQEDARGVFYRVHGGASTVARPYWDAQAALAGQSGSLDCAAGGRCIFTVIDRAGPNGSSTPDGKLDHNDNPPLEFHPKNALQLAPYLTASMPDGACEELLSEAGTPAVPAGSTPKLECTKRIIEFVRGQNTLGWDGEPRSGDRPCVVDKQVAGAGGVAQTLANCKLGDIFHSSPILVDPPVEPLVCDLALHPQCVQTLYARPNTFRPRSEARCADGVATPCYRETPLEEGAEEGQNAYDTFLSDVGYRQRVVVVGANDGMLHAFDAGSRVAGRERGSFTFGPDDVYSYGTGKEEWAFIPPDLLPKLRLSLKGHQLFVDGTAMVREVWVDGGASGTGSKDGVKQADEFHTLAVVGERGGGTKYFALDITDPLSVKRAVVRGAPSAAVAQQAASKPFRWLFPQPCDAKSMSMGQTWSTFAPKPPSIGPVRVKPQSLSSEDAKRGWSERWVAFVNGGYDPLQVTGRAAFTLDAWTGVDLWSLEAAAPPAASPTNADTSDDAYSALVKDNLHALAAAPALLDVGRPGHGGAEPDVDGFFDTVTVGDVGGNVWTFRMHGIGVLDASGRVANDWYAARSFEQGRSGGSADHSQRTPFFNMTSNALQADTGWLRTFLGTGDRQFMLEKDGGKCTPANPLACVRNDCAVTITRTQQVGLNRLVSKVEYSATGALKVTRTPSTDAGAACTKAELDVSVQVVCNPLSATPTTLSGQGHLRCSIANGTWTCSERENAANALLAYAPTAAQVAAQPRNRYYGFYAYGGQEAAGSTGGTASPASRTFARAAASPQTLASVLAYDGMRLTDVSRAGSCGAGMPASSCSLVDVTLPDPGVGEGCGGTAAGSPGETWEVGRQGGREVCYLKPESLAALPRGAANGPGWFLRYWPLDERTASGSSVLNNVVFWSSLTPPDVVQTSPCGETARGSSARSWQADMVTGLPGGGESFRLRGGDGTVQGYLPFRRRTVIAPPPEPITALSISRDGRVRQDVNLIEPGLPVQKETLRSARKVANDVYWMELPPSEHLCRHENISACE